MKQELFAVSLDCRQLGGRARCVGVFESYEAAEQALLDTGLEKAAPVGMNPYYFSHDTVGEKYYIDQIPQMNQLQ